MKPSEESNPSENRVEGSGVTVEAAKKFSTNTSFSGVLMVGMVLVIASNGWDILGMPEAVLN